MIADCHLHTEFSTDSTTPMEVQIQRAIELGMHYMCITDHMDMDFPDGEFVFDTDAYVARILELREKYRNQIQIGLGVEMGLQLHLKARINEYMEQYPFDYVIGSMHLLYGEDPYNGAIFQKVGDEQAYREYFQETHKNLLNAPDVDSLGHLDYIVRYGKTKAESYSYSAYADEIDAILKTIIEKQIALEVNTAGIRMLDFTNPHPDIIRRYKELGGELITIGSDGHVPEYLGYGFEKLSQLLTACGFSHYTVFRERKPEFISFS